MIQIPFNKPFLTGNELQYISEAVASGKISGNGNFTKKCQDFFEAEYHFKKTLLTTSCTDALEMSAILCDIQPGDEVILPSYTFVSTANAFALRGAKLVFVDSTEENPNMDSHSIEELITPKTKVIVPVHYAGIACDMDKIMALAHQHAIYVIEDAAQAIDSYYKGLPLGSIGTFSAFSFHETKNIISGEGGMLVINNKEFEKRAEIIWEKGTNRAEFFRGETNKYGWVDIGSSFLPSELISAFLFAQLENISRIQTKRKAIWESYYNAFLPLVKTKGIKLPVIPSYATNNAHMFYIVCTSLEERTQLIHYLKQHGVLAVFHYLSLHQSEYFKNKHDGRVLRHSDLYSDRLIRLPLFYELSFDMQELIIDKINEFYKK